MDNSRKKRAKILEAKYFGLLIGIFIIFLTMGLTQYTSIINNLETKILDVHFRLKNTFLNETIQEGVSYVEHNPNISPDILIVGIDFKTLTKFGKWPFPRFTHSYLIDTLSRITNPNERERALFIDIFFVEPDDKAIDDAILIESIKSSGRVFLETILDEVPPSAETYEEFFLRQKILYDNYGEIFNLIGNWESMVSFTGIQGPLQPYAAAARGYGHANYLKEKLRSTYHLYYDNVCMHEFVLSAKKMKEEFGISALDIAKGLLDYGVHPPTIYFPLIVPEAIMIEPTETESKETLDAFIDAMIKIAGEIDKNPDIVKNAPYTMPVKRCDEVKAARTPNLRYSF